MSDLYSAKTAFSYGFVSLEILELIISFLPDIYLFFVNCTLSGIASTVLMSAAFPVRCRLRDS